MKIWPTLPFPMQGRVNKINSDQDIEKKKAKFFDDRGFLCQKSVDGESSGNQTARSFSTLVSFLQWKGFIIETFQT